jgi:hypothetical protein
MGDIVKHPQDFPAPAGPPKGFNAGSRGAPDFLVAGSKTPVPEKELKSLKRMVETVGEVRRNKVSHLKKALADGNYHVETRKIAERVVKEAANDALHRGKCGLDRWPQDAD